MTSIRLRLVDWLQGIRDHVSKHLVQELGSAQMHAQPAGDVHNALVVGVDYTRTEGQAYNAIAHPSLSEEVNVFNRSVGVPNLPELIANRDLVPALNHNLVGHFVSPLNDYRMVQAKNAGVEATQ